MVDLKVEVKERKELKAEYCKDCGIDDNHGTFVRSDLGERRYFQFPISFYPKSQSREKSKFKIGKDYVTI